MVDDIICRVGISAHYVKFRVDSCINVHMYTLSKNRKHGHDCLSIRTGYLLLTLFMNQIIGPMVDRRWARRAAFIGNTVNSKL